MQSSIFGVTSNVMRHLRVVIIKCYADDIIMWLCVSKISHEDLLKIFKQNKQPKNENKTSQHKQLPLLPNYQKQNQLIYFKP